ncbi:MAG: hypothetical protein BGO55_08585 [Sphingobacteriales bacterium 50-39]|nr:MAG: hypothetical protein BGO55_08585 [Sphingobacteriales bacterium 50-39]
MNDQWLSDLLEKHCGLYRNDNNIELCQLPTGSYYIYCEHPVRVEKNLGVDLGICQLFDTADALAKGLSLETMEALNELNPETLLPLYYTGVMSINTYLPIEEHPVNLVFRRENGTTYFTDQESEAEYVAVDILEAPEDFIRLTHQYAIGDADSKVRRLPRERKL